MVMAYEVDIQKAILLSVAEKYYHKFKKTTIKTIYFGSLQTDGETSYLHQVRMTTVYNIPLL